LCLNLLCHVVLSLASESGDPTAAAALDTAVAADILAHALLEEDEPTPLYALKALGLMAGGPPPVGAPLGRLGAAQRFYEWLSVDHPCINMHNIRQCGRLAAAGRLGRPLVHSWSCSYWMP
jgi:serine/threonine-protein kinase ULK4